MDSIDMCPVLCQQAAQAVQDNQSYFAHFTSAHVQALQHCRYSLSSLCISDLLHPQPSDSIAGSMANIAQMRCLTKLHLAVDAHQVADFHPLFQLSMVQDLALQNSRVGVSCAGILTSSKHSLRYIVLSARSWSRDTYLALQQIPLLEVLLVKLYVLCMMQAHGLALVRARSIYLDLHCCAPEGLMTLSTARPEAEIHEMSLWGVSDNCCSWLESMPHLKTLIIVNAPDLTGVRFAKHTNMTELKMINCPGITTLGLTHMLKVALPALERLSFVAGSNVSCDNHMRMGPDALQALLRGRSLSHIDLRGVHGLPWRNLKTIVAKGGKTKLDILVPYYFYGRIHECQPVWRVHDYLDRPIFYAYCKPRSAEAPLITLVFVFSHVIVNTLAVWIVTEGTQFKKLRLVKRQKRYRVT